MSEEPDLISKSKNYDVRFPSSVLKQAWDLFWAYLDEKYKGDATLFWSIYTTDGEHIRVKTEQEFYFLWDDAARTDAASLQILTGSDKPKLLFRCTRTTTFVGVDLPSRNHVDNVLGLFTRDESRQLASLRSDLRAESDAEVRARPEPTKLTVFIGHGRDPQWERLRDFLNRDNRLNVLSFESGSRAGLATGAVIQQMADVADMAFIIHTGEDEEKSGAKHARDNVVHEAGMFQGKLGFNRAIVLLEEGCTEYSNISGISQIRFAKGQIDTKFGDVLQTLLREFPGRL